MMFVTTTNEKAVVAARLEDELALVGPGAHGLRVFDAGMGDASVLSQVLRGLHQTFAHIPWLVVGKEISIEDVRQGLEKLADRFHEHPEMVFVVTNMNYSEAPSLTPTDTARSVTWRNVELEGVTAHDFAAQIRSLYSRLAEDWEVRTDPKTGNPKYVRPAVLVVYRKDREFVLRPLIPRPGEVDGMYDLILASHPYRARTAAERKVRLVLVPLSRALAPGGRLVAVHAYGDDPGLEVIRGVWPGEDPFRTGRAELLEEARLQLDDPADGDLVFHEVGDDQARFRYHLHAMPSEVQEHIGTSLILAAWNAAVYVAQIDESRLSEAMGSGVYIEATRSVVHRHGGIWFNNETYTISRRGGSIWR